jgi:hypothetical protein
MVDLTWLPHWVQGVILFSPVIVGVSLLTWVFYMHRKIERRRNAMYEDFKRRMAERGE